MGILTTMGASLGGSALNKALNALFIRGYQPEKHKDDYLMGPREEGMLRQIGRRGVSEQAASGLGAFKQYASANRLPVGAVQAGLSGIAGEAAEKSLGFEGDLTREKQRRKEHYLGALEASQNRRQDRLTEGFNFTGEIGSLTRAMLLYKAGLLGSG